MKMQIPTPIRPGVSQLTEGRKCITRNLLPPKKKQGGKMLWFKHYTNASDDEFIAVLEAEFGLEGYARWWKLCETIAKQMDGTDKCHVEYPIEKWKGFLAEKREKKLMQFLEFCRDFVENSAEIPEKIDGNSPENSSKIGKISFEIIKKNIRIEIPKLLELRDEYSKKSGRKSGQVSGQMSGQNPDAHPDNIRYKNQESNQESDKDLKKSNHHTEPSEGKKLTLVANTNPPDDDSFRKKNFDVDLYLDDDDRRMENVHAPGWDKAMLRKDFNDWIKKPGQKIPSQPAKAYLSWLQKIKKGMSPP